MTSAYCRRVTGVACIQKPVTSTSCRGCSESKAISSSSALPMTQRPPEIETHPCGDVTASGSDVSGRSSQSTRRSADIATSAPTSRTTADRPRPTGPSSQVRAPHPSPRPVPRTSMAGKESQSTRRRIPLRGRIPVPRRAARATAYSQPRSSRFSLGGSSPFSSDATSWVAATASPVLNKPLRRPARLLSAPAPTSRSCSCICLR